jgi:serine/threonine protein kinase
LKLLNNRYLKIKRLGEGAYGYVYLAIDMKPDGPHRKADPKALEMLKEVKEGVSSDQVEDVKVTDAAEDTKQKEALKVLGDRAQVF